MSLFWIVSLFLFASFAYLFYIRYVPIIGVPCIDPNKPSKIDKQTLDIRDYQEAESDKIDHAIVIPVAYLKRYYNEIPSKGLYIVASNRLEKNVAIRFLKSKGFHIIGYTLTTCKCKEKFEKLA